VAAIEPSVGRFQADQEALAAPQLHRAAVQQLRRPGDGVTIIGANVGATTHEMAVRSDDVGPILVHLKVNPEGAGRRLALAAFMSRPLG
jgi:hypothetical protein